MKIQTLGVVYYANYLKYLEELEQKLYFIGFSNKKIQDHFNSLIIVKSCNIEYKKSARLEDELTIRSFVKSISKLLFYESDNYKGDETIVEAQVHWVF